MITLPNILGLQLQNSHIPFINQLTGELNNLHYIDASSEESLSRRRNQSPKLLNSRENLFNLSDFDSKLPVGDKSKMMRLNRQSSEASKQKLTGAMNQLRGTLPREEEDNNAKLVSSEEFEDSSSSSSASDEEPPQRKIDLKTYYLRRKASEPPKLPPKNK